MYLYFDVNGNLKEIIQIPVRQGSKEVNTIYAFVSPSQTVIEDGTYKKLSTYRNAKINFEALDSGVSLNPTEGSVLMTAITKQIPFDKNRDLKYFKYGYNYEFWSVELPSSVTAVSGEVLASIFLFETTPDFPLNRFSFNVEASVGVKLDSTMTESQYSYLYNLLNTYLNSLDNYVPYVNATGDVNLGTHDLSLRHLKSVNSDNTNNYLEIEYNGIRTFPGDTSPSFINIPFNVNGTFATQEWVQSQGYLTEHQSLSGLVPYSGAITNVNLGSNELTAGGLTARSPLDNNLYMEIRNATIALSRISPEEITPYYTSTFRFPTQSGTLALNSECRLFRHTVRITNPLDTNEDIVYVIYNKSSDLINSMLRVQNSIFFGDDENYYGVVPVSIKVNDAYIQFTCTDSIIEQLSEISGTYFDGTQSQSFTFSNLTSSNISDVAEEV